jgi:phosphatidate cytidylyltransferase
MWDWQDLDSHKQRVLTALLIGIPLTAILAAGPYWSWYLLVGVASAVGLGEFDSLVFRDGLPLPWLPTHVAGALLIPLGAAVGGSPGLHLALAVSLFAGFFCLLAFSPGDPAGIDRMSKLVLGWLYVPYLLSYVLLIGEFNAARAWLFFIFSVVIAADAGAYYSGRQFGRHKLYERVSPKKTIEGAVGGLAASMIVGTIFGQLFLPKVPVSAMLVMGGCLALVSQVGDLVESMIKRMYGQKDSSRLLPGHGGLLDRLDSLLFVFPTAWFFLKWLNQTASQAFI